MWTLANAERLRDGWAEEQRLVEDLLRQVQRHESLPWSSNGSRLSGYDLEPGVLLGNFPGKRKTWGEKRKDNLAGLRAKHVGNTKNK